MATYNIGNLIAAKKVFFLDEMKYFDNVSKIRSKFVSPKLQLYNEGKVYVSEIFYQYLVSLYPNTRFRDMEVPESTIKSYCETISIRELSSPRKIMSVDTLTSFGLDGATTYGFWLSGLSNLIDIFIDSKDKIKKIKALNRSDAIIADVDKFIVLAGKLKALREFINNDKYDEETQELSKTLELGIIKKENKQQLLDKIALYIVDKAKVISPEFDMAILSGIAMNYAASNESLKNGAIIVCSNILKDWIKKQFGVSFDNWVFTRLDVANMLAKSPNPTTKDKNQFYFVDIQDIVTSEVANKKSSEYGHKLLNIVSARGIIISKNLINFLVNCFPGVKSIVDTIFLNNNKPLLNVATSITKAPDMIPLITVSKSNKLEDERINIMVNNWNKFANKNKILNPDSNNKESLYNAMTGGFNTNISSKYVDPQNPWIYVIDNKYLPALKRFIKLAKLDINKSTIVDDISKVKKANQLIVDVKKIKERSTQYITYYKDSKTYVLINATTALSAFFRSNPRNQDGNIVLSMDDVKYIRKNDPNIAIINENKPVNSKIVSTGEIIDNSFLRDLEDNNVDIVKNENIINVTWSSTLLAIKDKIDKLDIINNSLL